MLTFSDIYEAMRKEKYSEQLQALSKKFLADVAEYFSEKKDFLSKSDDLFSDNTMKNKKKLENAIVSFKDLIRIRKKKILNLAFVASEVGINKRDFENLLSFEKDLFEEIVKSLEKAEASITDEMSGEKDEQKHLLVRFIEGVSEFLDFEGNGIGPFEKGEIANIEKEIAEILLKDKKVEIVD
jgi:DNA replication initiation complex subunit (GINS family)